MIDLGNLEKYRENNRIEAKKALGGLPHSIWETYSAFANTFGGIILLGVEEHKDKTLHAIDLPYPEKLINEFWDIVNNPNKVNVNILTNNHVRIEEINGCRIVIIEVPRAQRYYKPVYVDGNPVTGTYRRNGEGDYHCTEEELRAMYRDADIRTQDMLIMEQMGFSVFCSDSINAYRQRMSLSRPNHVWEQLDDEEFLMRLGAMGIGSDGKLHPTAAGLLMFGYEFEIVREYPQYFLDYREEYDDTHRWTDRIISSSGDWSGNIFDFFYRVYNRIQLDIKVPFETRDGFRIDDTPVHGALREALANCLINADYYGRRGLVIIQRRDMITISNPGDFRVGLDEARAGGLSDPRNSVLMKMFNLIDIGERAGSGIPSILYTWKQQGWSEPTITLTSEPNCVVLSLPLTTSADNTKSADNSADNGNSALISGSDDTESADKAKKALIKASAQKEMIVSYLTDYPDTTTADLCRLLDLKPTRVRMLLRQLIAANIVIAVGGNRNRTYRLRS